MFARLCMIGRFDDFAATSTDEDSCWRHDDDPCWSANDGVLLSLLLLILLCISRSSCLCNLLGSIIISNYSTQRRLLFVRGMLYWNSLLKINRTVCCMF